MLTTRRAFVATLALLAILTAAVAVGPTQPAGAGGPMGIELPPAPGCTNPAHTGAPIMGGLDPRQIATTYGVDHLWEAGQRGEGMHVALIEPGERLDQEKFDAFNDCWGPFTQPVETVIGGGTPGAIGGEPNFDSYAVLAMAPKLARLDLFESESNVHSSYPALFEAALDPANTGGKLVDAISISFDNCEASWSQEDLDATQAWLEKAADLGVKVFAAAGDSGSLGSYVEGGTVECVQHPVAPTPPLGVQLDVIFPASSPWVTAVGGTQLEIDGTTPHHGAPHGGHITGQVVWDQPTDAATGTYAGGGGLSRVFPAAEWQVASGLTGMAHRPDIAALAGWPTYFNGGIGTSGAAPAMAGAAVVLDQHLAANDTPTTGFLNPLLYELARGPEASRVFYDITEGTSDLYNLGCCTAGPGYDLASGLGSIRFDGLAAVLVERAHPATTTTSTTAPTGSPAPVAPRFAG